MKKIWIVILSLVLLMGLTVPVSATADSKGMDVVIIIDTSGSMKSTDPEKTAIEAAKMFIDMIKMQNSRVGIVGFSGSITKELPLTEVGTVAQKDSLKKEIDSLVYNGETDMGLALKTGNEILNKASDVGNDKMILLFTDGKIEFVDSKRTVKDSEKDVDQVINEAVENYPIYTIGLNSKQNIDKALITKIAEKTGGRCYVVENADKLPDIFNSIFADFVKSNLMNLGEFVTDGVNATEVKIDIPNDSVAEANIVMLSSAKLSEITLVDPSGNQVPIDNDQVILSTSKKYSMLKIVAPQKGSWNLKIKGEKGLKVQINLLFNYDISLVMELAEADKVRLGQSVEVTGYLNSPDGKVTDSDFYANFTGVIQIEKEDGSVTQAPMTTEKDGFKGRFLLEEEGTYQISIRADSESFYRVSEGKEIILKNTPPVLAKDADTNIKLSGFIRPSKGKLFDLTKFIDASGNSSIDYEVSGSNKDVTAAIKDGKLDLKPLKNGSAVLTLKATGDGGQSFSTDINVTVDYKIQSIMILVLIILGILLAVLVVIIILKTVAQKNTAFYGKIKYSIIAGNTTAPEQIYNLCYDKGNIKLKKFIHHPKIADTQLNQVLIAPVFDKGNAIKITNGSNGIMSGGYGGSSIKQLTLKNGTMAVIAFGEGADKIIVKLQYIL